MEKMSKKMERMILGIVMLPNSGLNSKVKECYDRFMHGELEVHDSETGERFNPSDFADKNGKPLEMTESVIIQSFESSVKVNNPKNSIDYEMLSSLMDKLSLIAEVTRAECAKENPDEVTICDHAIEELDSLISEIESCVFAGCFTLKEARLHI